MRFTTSNQKMPVKCILDSVTTAESALHQDVTQFL